MKYGVRVLFTYSVTNHEKNFYEQTIYLVEAESYDEAYLKTEKYINKYEYDHLNPNNELVKRERIELIDCFCVVEEDDEDVEEIYSCIIQNTTLLNEDEFYEAIVSQCDADQMYDLRYKEFND